MAQILSYLLLFSSVFAPFVCVFTFFKTIRLIVKDEPYEGMALATSLCLIWLLACVINIV